jgi:hypothetical protein
MRGAKRWLTSALALCSLACAGPGASKHADRCEVAPIPSNEIPEGLDLRARMRIAAGSREIGLEVVGRESGGDLVVVGFTPYGVRLFTVRQEEREVSVEAAASRGVGPLPFFVMDALHRLYFAGASRAPSDGVSIEYPEVSGAAASADAPVTIRNSRCGYEAVVVTLEATPQPGE